MTLAEGLRFVAARLARALAVLLLVLVGCFLLLRLAPGDPALAMASAAGLDDPQYVAELRRQMGLDLPLWRQLGHYLWRLAQGDLGYSRHNQEAVWPLIAERLPATLLLSLSALALSSLVGIALGAVAARSRERRGATNGLTLDKVISALSLLLYAIPVFWLALLLIMLFSVGLNLLPAFGLEEVAAAGSGRAWLLDRARHLVLPCVSLSLVFVAIYVHLTRASLLQTYAQDHVRATRAKGVGEARVLLRHVLPNALLPVTTYAGLQLGQLASAGLLVEVVYAWPGIGRLLYESLEARDYPLLLGILLVISALVLLGNLLAELTGHLLDPRLAWRLGPQ